MSMRQLTFVKPGRLEWHDVPRPRVAADTDALVRPIGGSEDCIFQRRGDLKDVPNRGYCQHDQMEVRT